MLVLPLMTKAVEGMVDRLKHNDCPLPASANTCRLSMPTSLTTSVSVKETNLIELA